MIGGNPSRGPQSMDRRPAQAQRPSGWQSEDSWASAPRPAAQPVAPQPQAKKVVPPAASVKKKPKFKGAIVAVAALMVLVLVSGFIWMSTRAGVTSMIDSDKYQGVFFSNGQVYFGKLEIINKDYMKLTDVFYIQSEASTEGVGEDGAEPSSGEHKLIKRGAEVYGPEDMMIIDSSQVMFFENLKTDSEVSQLIKNYKPNNK